MVSQAVLSVLVILIPSGIICGKHFTQIYFSDIVEGKIYVFFVGNQAIKIKHVT